MSCEMFASNSSQEEYKVPKEDKMIVLVTNIREGDTVQAEDGTVATVGEIVPMGTVDHQSGIIVHLTHTDGTEEDWPFRFGSVRCKYVDRIAAA